MGKVMKVLWGSPSKSKQKSQQTSSSQSVSGNYAYDDMKSTYSPAMAQGNRASGLMASLLGMNGDDEGRKALDTFNNSSGLDFVRSEGVRGVEGSQAARGMLNSGSTLTALQDRGQNLGKTYLNQFMEMLMKQSDTGLRAGSLLAGTGGYSNSKSTGQGTSSGNSTGEKKGIAADLVKIAAAASDRRLKTNIELMHVNPDGLGVYRYNYVDGFGLPTTTQVGYMADEVKEVYPDAYIPNFIGEYAGVDYARIG